MRRAALAALVGALFITGAPAAQAADGGTRGDPWEHMNRRSYALEGALDRVIFKPASELFKHIAPGRIGEAVHNLLVNLSEPNAFINDMLQARFERAGVAAGRFVTNSTIGLVGMVDVARRLGLVHHDNEFGVTLGVYGVGPGPYLYVPLLGPTTVRDLIGSGIDAFIDPIHWAQYANRPEISVARAVVSGLDLRVATEAQLNALLSDATDPYATLRSVYLQNKEAEVRGENAPLDNLPSFDDPTAPAAPAPASAGAIPLVDSPTPGGSAMIATQPTIRIAPPAATSALTASIAATTEQADPTQIALIEPDADTAEP
jgi:phospholipid-binding lipoprotein MlaA